MPQVSPEIRIDRAGAALLIIDVQERLWAAMPAERERVLRNLLVLLELARRLGLPVVASEQYPKGLGPTVPELAAALGPDAHRLEKLEFSCAAAPGFGAIWEATGRRQWIVAGMESHVCVYQTVRDLAALGASVHVVADAVISRGAENRAVGLDLCARAGAFVTSTEVIVFDALGVAGTEDFRALSRLVK